MFVVRFARRMSNWGYDVDLQIEFSGLSCDDVLEFPAHFPGWDLDLLQISGGHFGFSQFRVQLPGLTVAVSNLSRQFELLAQHKSNVICFAAILSSERPLRFQGAELSKPHLIMLTPENEHFLVFGGRTKTLDLQIDLNTLRRIGWDLDPKECYEVSGAELGAFHDWCLNLKRFEGKSLDLASVLRVRHQALHLLAQLIREDVPFGSTEVSLHEQNSDLFETVTRARSLLRRLPMDTPLRIPALAGELGMSDRQLYRDFKSCVGIGPARYFELMRLHALRNCLKNPDNGFASMSDAAKRFGFSNPGRMALRYNELFFEPPSHTFRRSRDLSPA